MEPALGPKKTNELRSSLSPGPTGGGAIAAEWELAILDRLATAGALEFLDTTERNVDAIFAASATGERAMVEITAISDQGLHDKFPVDVFSERLGKIAFGLRPAATGSLDYQFGQTELNNELVIGVPEKSNLDEFFSSVPFKEFLVAIRKEPAKPHKYDFECRGARSWIAFRPGQQYTHGGYAAFDGLKDLRKNHVTARLKKKDEQLRASNQALPGIVVLCDGHCAAIKSRMASFGKPQFEDVVDVFLNGRPKLNAGPIILQQGVPSSTRRINAIVVIGVREQQEGIGSRFKRFFEIRYAFNRGNVLHPLAERTVQAICESLRDLPPISTASINARREYRFPVHYGGWEASSSRQIGRLKVKMSLLTLQGLLAGAINQSEFVRDHDTLVTAMRKTIAEGGMISKIEVENRPDEDDDWVHVEFERRQPTRLFDARKRN
jgi:hypothetical protein